MFPLLTKKITEAHKSNRPQEGPCIGENSKYSVRHKYKQACLEKPESLQMPGAFYQVWANPGFQVPER
jgi:hypothetical protein